MITLQLVRILLFHRQIELNIMFSECIYRYSYTYRCRVALEEQMAGRRTNMHTSFYCNSIHL